jgi:hypothetical protein
MPENQAVYVKTWLRNALKAIALLNERSGPRRRRFGQKYFPSRDAE